MSALVAADRPFVITPALRMAVHIAAAKADAVRYRAQGAGWLADIREGDAAALGRLLAAGQAVR